MDRRVVSKGAVNRAVNMAAGGDRLQMAAILAADRLRHVTVGETRNC